MENSTTTTTKNENYNLPNLLILIRFGLAIVVIILLAFVPLSLKNGDFVFVIDEITVSGLNVIAMILFGVAAFTDWWDGKLARKNNQITNFGKFFDPLADKILVNSVLIFFAAFGYIPVWVVVIFIVRDLMVDGLRMNLATKGKVLAADKYGKLKTVFQMFGILLLFIFHPAATTSGGFAYGSIQHVYLIPIYVALFFSCYSGVKYYTNNIEDLI